jgi:hypothetical protein
MVAMWGSIIPAPLAMPGKDHRRSPIFRRTEPNFWSRVRGHNRARGLLAAIRANGADNLPNAGFNESIGRLTPIRPVEQT